MRDKIIVILSLIILSCGANISFADEIEGATPPIITTRSALPISGPVSPWYGRGYVPYCPYYNNYNVPQTVNTVNTVSDNTGLKKIITTSYPSWGNNYQYPYNPYWGRRYYYPPYQNTTSNSVGGNILRSFLGLN